MKVICFRGNRGSGKSTTIKEILNRIFNITKIDKKNKKDFCLTFPYNGKMIGICSYGDDISSVKERLEKIKNVGCNIVICASRNNPIVINCIKEALEIENIIFIDCPDVGENIDNQTVEMERRISLFKQEFNSV